MSWLTRTNWLDGQSPNGNDFSNLGLDIRTWGGTVDAASNPLVGLSLMRFTPAALPSVPSAGSFVYDTADAKLKFYNGAGWSIVGGVASAIPDPGANGLIKRTALNTSAIATPGTDYYVPGATLATLTVTAAIAGSVTGNAGTVTAGVYTSGSYTDPSWLTISKTKVGLSAVENTALSTWAGSANITAIGTLTAGFSVVQPGNQLSTILVQNTDATDTGAGSLVNVVANWGGVTLMANGSARSVSRFGVTLGGYAELAVLGGAGLVVGTRDTTPLILGTNALQRMWIDGTTGNVGIGTSSPLSTFHVQGPAASNLQTWFASASGYGSYIEIGPTATPVELTGTSSGDFLIGHYGGPNVFQSVRLGAVANTLVLKAGFVGIGTASPQVPLDVVGTMTLRPAGGTTAQLRIGQASASNNFQIRTNVSMAFPNSGAQDDVTQPSWATSLGGVGDSWGIYHIPAGGTTWSPMLTVLGATGCVGIGTSSPGANLDVMTNNGTGCSLCVTTYDNGAGATSNITMRRARGTLASPTAIDGVRNLDAILFQGFDGTAFGNGAALNVQSEVAWTTSDHSASLQFFTATGVAWTEKMRITGAGKVGIGTSTPTAPLHVVGLTTYASNAAAITAGLTAGAFYTDGSGAVKVVY